MKKRCGFLITFLTVVLFSTTNAKIVDLGTGWELSNNTIRITGINLPSGVYTELERNNITESVLFSRNDVDLRWIGLINWTYALLFEGKK